MRSTKPCHIGYLEKCIEFNCLLCGKIAFDRKSHYSRKKRHFCSIKCYSEFRSTHLPMEEQHAYKGVRKPRENKQIYHRNYVKSHPNNIKHLKARRYAREKGAEGSHSLDEWNSLLIKHNNKCAICFQSKPLTKDHIRPLSKGGSDYIENIQPLCKNCNSKKHNKLIYENPQLLNS